MTSLTQSNHSTSTALTCNHLNGVADRGSAGLVVKLGRVTAPSGAVTRIAGCVVGAGLVRQLAWLEWLVVVWSDA
jgi:hypothetical protein